MSTFLVRRTSQHGPQRRSWWCRFSFFLPQQRRALGRSAIASTVVLSLVWLDEFLMDGVHLMTYPVFCDRHKSQTKAPDG